MNKSLVNLNLTDYYNKIPHIGNDCTHTRTTGTVVLTEPGWKQSKTRLAFTRIFILNQLF